MKTLDKASFWVFATLAAASLIAACFGETHQLAITGICAFVAIISRIEYINQNNAERTE